LVGGPVAGGDPNQTIQGQYCDICTAAHSNRAHPVSNAIDGTERWWQSPPLSRGLQYNEVNVTLDLGQVFHVAYVLIKFANSPRPDLWVLERSTDFGRTYQPWQFFASSKRDCFERFGPQTLQRIVRDDHVICSTEYSRIVPLENGEIVVSLVNGRPGAMNFSYSPLLREFTKATNIRLRFLRTNTLLGHLMGKALRDPTVTRRYYYSIKDISIGGRCVCHGHADVCDAQDPADPFRLQCTCQHNTCGGSCDHCCPGFNQRPWKPATTDSANECQACNCHGHAHDCFYDPEVDRRNASQSLDGTHQGGGVCIDCQHHTTGINCERCLPGFFRAPDQPLDSPHACRRCDCESDFTDGTCEDLTGRCYCWPNFTGERCDACAEGFAGFPHCTPVSPSSPNHTGEQVLPAGQIVNCDCSAAGTQGNACRKDPRVGRCVCKPAFQGVHCELCAPGFYGPGCQPCQCSSPGVVDGDCDPDSGQCTCREGFEGAACDRCTPGYFHFPLCQLCGCSPVGTLPQGCDETGRCPCRPGFDGPHCDRCRPDHHGYPDCHACTCDPRGALDQLCGAGGVCRCRPGYTGAACQECSPAFHGFPECAPCRCSPEGSLHAACDPRSGQCSCRPRVTGLRCDACVAGAYDFPFCEAGSCHPAGLAPADHSRPEAQAPCTCRAHVEGPSCDRCKPGFWGLSPSNPEGCTRCSCDPRGTLGGVLECRPGDGQCPCKPHVCGQACAACRDGFFGLDQADYFGCRGCRCDVGGALGQGCDPRTGACRCRPNTQGLTCSEPARDHYLPDLHHLRLELEEAATPEGHTVRFGFNPLEFESFSWRGYAQMSPVQPRIVVRLNVTSPDLFRLVFRYVNRGPTSVSGRVSMQEEGKLATCTNCTEQSQPVTFPPSTEPAFVTVPQRGFGEPFVLNPGTWALLVEAEGVLLDYGVLLPSTYYEAALLQLRVTEACTFRPAEQRSTENCLLYTHLPLDGFPSAAGTEALCRRDNSLPWPCPTEQLNPVLPPLAACLGSDVRVPGTPQGDGRGGLGEEGADVQLLQTRQHHHELLAGHGTVALRVPEAPLRAGTVLSGQDGALRGGAARRPGKTSTRSPTSHRAQKPTPDVGCEGQHVAGSATHTGDQSSSRDVRGGGEELPLPAPFSVLEGRHSSGGPRGPSGPYRDPGHPPSPPCAWPSSAHLYQLQLPMVDVAGTRQPAGHVRPGGYLQHHVRPAFHGDEHVSPLGLRVKFVGGRGLPVQLREGLGPAPQIGVEQLRPGPPLVLLRVRTSRRVWAELLQRSVAPKQKQRVQPFGLAASREKPPEEEFQQLRQHRRWGARPLTLQWHWPVTGSHTLGMEPASSQSQGRQLGASIPRDTSPRPGPTKSASSGLTSQNHRPSGTCTVTPLTLPDSAPTDEDLHGEGGVSRLVPVQQEGVAAQRGHVGGKDHRPLQGEAPLSGRRVAGRGWGPGGRALGAKSWERARGRPGGSGSTRQSRRTMGWGGFRKRDGRQVALEGAQDRGQEPFSALPGAALLSPLRHPPCHFLRLQDHDLPLSSSDGILRGKYNEQRHRSRLGTPLRTLCDRGTDTRPVWFRSSRTQWPDASGGLGPVRSGAGGQGLTRKKRACLAVSRTLASVSRWKTARRPVDAGVQGERPLLGRLAGDVHAYAHLLAGVLTGILHQQDVAARLRHGHLKLNVHLGDSDKGPACSDSVRSPDAPGHGPSQPRRPQPLSPRPSLHLCPHHRGHSSRDTLRPSAFQPLLPPSLPYLPKASQLALLKACCLEARPGASERPNDPLPPRDRLEDWSQRTPLTTLVPGNCSRCDCSPCGTETCDPHSGHCVCKPGVTGRRCDRCQEGYFGFQSCGGCQPCACGPAAEGSECHPQSGQCHCRPGAGGPQCRECALGHWGRPEEGCRRCQCQGGHCDLHTGRCTCPPGLSGERCDTCSHQHQVLVPSGPGDRGVHCEVCDHCVVLLLDDLERAGALLPAIREQLQGVSASTTAWAQLYRLNASIADLQSQLRSPPSPHHEVTQQLEALEQQSSSLGQNTQGLDGQAGPWGAPAWEAPPPKLSGDPSPGKPLPMNLLAQLFELLRGMDQAREEYEHLAASLDGAQMPLLEKMRAFSPASSKVELVEAAEAHAQQLAELALNLTSIIQGVNQDRFTQRAIEAANAYASILQAVWAAEDAAGQALQQAGHTWAMVVQRGLAPLARELLANSSALVEAGLREQQRLGRVWATLQGTGPRLLDVQAKKEQLAARIQEVQAMLAMDTDETRKKITHAKAVAEEVQATAARVQARVQDMRQSAERWRDQYGGLQSQDLDQAVLDAGRSVSTLEKTLPQLLAKLSLLENRRAHNASRALSASIGRVRELIAQARGAANKVKVPMKFNGRSGVQLRAPRDLSDLAAYTALKFYLQSPKPESGQVTGDRFVLYMGSRQAVGDYMGVALRDQRVHWVYRLGEAGPAALSVDEDIGEQFAAVSIDRTLQFGHMSVTVEKQMAHETKGDTVAPGIQGLLSLQPDDFVFYVGGYPSNFTPPEPLRFPGYLGCIEMDTLNEEVFSLYNFEETFQLNTAVDKPCARSKAIGDPWLTDGSYLDGSGFARISVGTQIGQTKRFEQELRLVSSRGIIFFMRHQDQFLCLAVQKGNLTLLYDFGKGLQEAQPQHDLAHKLQALTSASKAIQVFLLADSQGRKRVLVRVERSTVFNVDHSSTLELADAYYLGGAPPAQLPPSLRQLFPSGGSIRGCIKGIKALGKYVDLKRLNTTGVSAGCTADLLMQRAVTFHGNGFLSLELADVAALTGHVYSGFGFRSTQDSGLLYHRGSEDELCQVSLQQGRVTLLLLRTEVKTRDSFADGAPHYVAFYGNDTGVWLYVDDQLQQMKPRQGPPPGPQSQSPQASELSLGGRPEPSDFFSGCISNVFVLRLLGPQHVFDLQQYSRSVNVTSDCTPPLRAQTLQWAPQGRRAAALRKAPRRGRHPPRDPACTPPRPLRTIRNAYQFGGTLSSHLEFAHVPNPSGNGSQVSMLVQPRAPGGLLLLATPLTASSPSLLLLLSHGHFVAQTEGPGPQLRVRSRQRSQLGLWHTLSVQWEKTWIQLVVDGVRAQDREWPGQQHLDTGSPQPRTLFVGGLPASGFNSRLPVAANSSGFSGCVRRLRLDGWPLRTPTRAVGVMPCFSGPLEKGLFFAESGGVVTADTLGAALRDVSLELEVRPLRASGLIFHLGRAQAPPSLQLQVRGKQVLLRADDGAGEFSTWVTCPAALCDGQWHRLAVTKDGNVLQLTVDTRTNSTQGPTAATSEATLAPLHLGGLPGPASTQAGPLAYHGCMRNLVVNRSPFTWPRTVGIEGAVGGSGCPNT
ncbi:laminin subunit alpha-5, partial [Suricata suricatta]|uniref:laminin subunit alpha-5 n=1 Tax=Suricata suricatta TaxID=37032 RepID=UPI001155C049